MEKTKIKKVVFESKDVKYTLGCMKIKDMMYCVCGKCKQEPYPLPRDFKNK